MNLQSYKIIAIKRLYEINITHTYEMSIIMSTRQHKTT